MPIKEYQIVEFFLGSVLKDEVMQIMPVQKQTRAGQRTRFKVRRAPQPCPLQRQRAVAAGVPTRLAFRWCQVGRHSSSPLPPANTGV